ncbi:hypothetical protein D9613_011166 [Agrocybe pediades]|uniref:Uncharacterized protein n=1 Tax=Agrocybe pediades TaxID=84607 RepID=A0A8H4QLG0_9AGAR|nr:hypothetical protein D9613_011166 [Agrocybe pediades]
MVIYSSPNDRLPLFAITLSSALPWPISYRCIQCYFAGVNQGQLESVLPPVPEPCSHMPASCNNCWREYPQSLYPNWTPEQVRKSKIDKAIKQYRRDVRCVIHQVDVDENGLFAVPEDGRIESDDSLLEDTWIRIVNNKAPIANRVRALFIENMSGPVLQMLGAKYNIEPFFFSSSLNWIPSRYQEQVMPGDGDHITLCLIFLRSVPDGSATSMSAVSPYPAAQVEGNVRGNGNVNGAASTPFHGSPSTSTLREDYELSLLADQMIDTQAPLVLKSNRRLLVLDLLSVHLIRRAQGSVIISYHADKDLPTTTAPYLHERIQFAGQSVYWQKIFQTSPDPTFVLLTFMWHALYSWDEALENLYTHICSLESHVITTSEMTLTQELHAIRAHHLHYASLLNDFRKTVTFIRNTENPALERLSDEERKANASLLSRECENLLTEIARLEKARKMQDSRLKNVMNLVFSSVNIIDSRRMQKMTEAAAKDSAAVRLHLPATWTDLKFELT